MDAKIAIGIDIGGTNIKAGFVSADGSILYETSRPTRAFEGRDALLAQLASLAEELVALAVRTGSSVSGIGVGTAGYVTLDGAIAEATGNLPGWSGTRLKEILERRLRLPVSIDNDANAMAVGEMWLGVGRGLEDAICVTLGTGIGGAIIRNRKHERGRDGYAGGFGHQTIVFGGHPCTCGLRGCWEQYASVTALRRFARESIGGEVSPEQLFVLAQEGDAQALSVIDRYAQHVAAGLANLIHIFNPSAFIVGGAVTAQGAALFGPIRHYMEKFALGAFVKREVLLLPAELGSKAGMVGAAKLGLDASE
ncbi:ROK family protein [Cohnella sp. 56]|uniref:ROK family protein n=1 Tax=Cohnella sp. 56 TaxID=3113722 RepID=UPI0030E79F46